MKAYIRILVEMIYSINAEVLSLYVINEFIGESVCKKKKGIISIFFFSFCEVRLTFGKLFSLDKESVESMSSLL